VGGNGVGVLLGTGVNVGIGVSVGVKVTVKVGFAVFVGVAVASSRASNPLNPHAMVPTIMAIATAKIAIRILLLSIIPPDLSSR
jgi:hypothetical protein